MGSYPKCKITFSASKPANSAYPKELRTIGDHLRKVRLDRGLSQPQVAKILGVTTNTVTIWELNQRKPQASLWPKVIKFIGYYPFEDDRTIGFRVVKFRRLQGLPSCKLAKLCGVNERTVTKLEKNQYGKFNSKVSQKVLEYINSFVGDK